jgi:phosphatidylinositol alpha-1,6-mannosyltransferase
MKNLLTLSDGLHLNGAVTFHGALYGSSLWSKYAEACVFAMPARESTEDVEGFGTVFLEAGAFGVPSIATRTGGIPEAVIEGVTGKLVENDDVDGLTNAIGVLLQDRVERQRLGTNARTWASNFTWAASTDQVLRLMGGEDG